MARLGRSYPMQATVQHLVIRPTVNPSVTTVPQDFTNADWVKTGSATGTSTRLSFSTSGVGEALTTALYSMDEERFFWKVALTPAAASGGIVGGLQIGPASTTSNRALIIVDDTNIKLYLETGGSITRNANITTTDAAKPFYSLREAGGTLYYERSATGAPGTWETLATDTAPAWLSSASGTFRTPFAVNAWIENLNQVGVATHVGAVNSANTSTVTADGSPPVKVGAVTSTNTTVVTADGIVTKIGAVTSSNTSTVTADGTVTRVAAVPSSTTTAVTVAAQAPIKVGAVTSSNSTTVTADGLVTKIGAVTSSNTTTVTADGLVTKIAAVTVSTTSVVTFAGTLFLGAFWGDVGTATSTTIAPGDSGGQALPSNIPLGAVGIVVIGGSHATSVTYTPPAGWSLLDEFNSSTTVDARVYTKTLGPSDSGTTPVWTASSTQKLCLGGVVIAPFAIEAAGVQHGTATGTAVSYPAGTPVAANAMQIGLSIFRWGSDQGTDGSAFSTPLSFVEQVDANTNFGVAVPNVAVQVLVKQLTGQAGVGQSAFTSVPTPNGNNGVTFTVFAAPAQAVVPEIIKVGAVNVATTSTVAADGTAVKVAAVTSSTTSTVTVSATSFDPTQITWINTLGTVIGSAGGTATSVTAVLPTGYTTGDFLICYVLTGVDSTVSTPAGWTFKERIQDTATLPAAATIDVFFKFAASASETNPAFTFGTTTRGHAVVSVYRNVDQIAPFLTTAAVAEAGGAGTTTHSAPAITNSNIKKFALFAIASRQNPTPYTMTPSIGLTERYDADTGNANTLNTVGMVADTDGVVAATTGQTYSADGSATSAVAAMWVAYLSPLTTAALGSVTVATTSAVTADGIVTKIAAVTSSNTSLVTVNGSPPEKVGAVNSANTSTVTVAAVVTKIGAVTSSNTSLVTIAGVAERVAAVTSTTSTAVSVAGIVTRITAVTSATTTTVTIAGIVTRPAAVTTLTVTAVTADGLAVGGGTVVITTVTAVTVAGVVTRIAAVTSTNTTTVTVAAIRVKEGAVQVTVVSVVLVNALVQRFGLVNVITATLVTVAGAIISIRTGQLKAYNIGTASWDLRVAAKLWIGGTWKEVPFKAYRPASAAWVVAK